MEGSRRTKTTQKKALTKIHWRDGGLGGEWFNVVAALWSLSAFTRSPRILFRRIRHNRGVGVDRLNREMLFHLTPNGWVKGSICDLPPSDRIETWALREEQPTEQTSTTMFSCIWQLEAVSLCERQSLRKRFRSPMAEAWER